MMKSHVILTVLKDVFGMEAFHLPPPPEEPEEGCLQAVEVCKQAEEVGVDGKCIAHGGEGEKMEERKENGGGQKVGQELDEEEYVKRLPSYKEVIKKAVRFFASRYPRKKESFTDTLLKFGLQRYLDSALSLPLKHQGMRIVVSQALKLYSFEGSKTKDVDKNFMFGVTIFAESIETEERERKPVWGLTIETRRVLVNTLEKAAAVVVAKALGLRGEMGLEELDIAGKQKSIVREFLDKEEKEVVEEEMGGLKEELVGEEGGGGDGVGQVDGEVGVMELQSV